MGDYLYRTRSNWAYFIAVLVIGVIVAISYLTVNKPLEALVSVMNTAAVAVLFWVFVAGPKIIYTENHIEIHNPFKIVVIGWLKAEDFITKYSFTVITSSRKISAWAAPAPGALNSRRIQRTDFRGTALESRLVVASSESSRAESGVAFILALKHKETALTNGTASETLETRVNWLSIALVVGGTLALLSNFIQ
jgi:hypothetical protein